MLSKSQFPAQGKTHCKEIWRRGEIESIDIESDGQLRVELAWVALKRGPKYFEDISNTTIDICVDRLERGGNYSLIIKSVDTDISLVYCFAEPGHDKNISFPQKRLKVETTS